MKKNIVYHIARTKSELEQAFSLVYKEYIGRGYIPKHYKSDLRISIFNALPSTTTFVAKDKNKVVATVTLIPDSPLGLPMDKIYKKEVDVLRKKKRKIAEVSQLSIDSSLFPKGWFSMFNFNKLMFVFRLFKLVLDYGIYKEKLNDFCIAVNPKHQYLYKFLEFKQLGKLKYYGEVNQAPALAWRFNLDEAEKRAAARKGLYNVFFGEKTKPEAFKGKYRYSVSDLEYFFLKKSGHFKKAAKRQLDYIQSCYPKKNIKRVIKKYEISQKK